MYYKELNMNIQMLKAAVAGLILSVSGLANAGLIVSATGAVINSGGPGFGSILDTINQNGLSTGYVSGVTDFDSYIASNPSHTIAFGGYEWFGNSSETASSVTYDLGSLTSINALALWNEETEGIPLLDLYVSSDNVNFNALSLGLTPVDNPLADYLPEVFSFSDVNTRYVRFDMSSCTHNDWACAIGEVAFRTAEPADSTSVPEPSTLAIFALGIMGLASRRLKK